MLYRIRVRNPAHDLSSLRDYADIVATPTADGAVLSCRVQDRAALSGVVALLCDLGLDITELLAVTEEA